MIRLQGVHKTYRDGSRHCEVLRNVDLSIEAGEMVALMGASGSGKSTLLHIVGALDSDYRGDVRVAGASLREMNDAERSRFRSRTVGFVFQQFHLLPHLTVLENVVMPGWFASEDLSEGRARAVDVLKQVGLAGLERRTPGRLSGGERQRVAIARALFNRPRLLLCDEPTGALDTTTGAQVMDVFSLLHEAGMTTLLVTHDGDVAARAGRILNIRDGQISDAPEDAP